MSRLASELLIRMLEKRTSHHKSTRSPPPPAAAAEVPKTIASEVVPAITQTKQATFDLVGVGGKTKG